MDNIGEIIKLAGARETIPDERFERARQSVHSHWQQVVAQQPAYRLRRFRPLAIAASVLIVVSATFVLWNQIRLPSTPQLASVERVLGEVQINNENIHDYSEITANTLIQTGETGRIAIRMSGGQSLRINTSSKLTVHSPNHISLETGAIYIDSSNAQEEPMRVSTPLGIAQDIGTQFQVSLSGMQLVVGVRQGLVEVTRAGQKTLSISKGFYAELNNTDDSELNPLQTNDPNWAWIETIAPQFDIQNANLAQYLQWYTQESGLELVWANADSELNALNTQLSGSIAGSSLAEGLLLVKQVAPFQYQVTGDRFWVKVE